MKEKITNDNAVILANIAELTYRIIKKVSGNDISNKVNESKVTRELCNSLVFQKASNIFIDRSSK